MSASPGLCSVCLREPRRHGSFRCDSCHASWFGRTDTKGARRAIAAQARAIVEEAAETGAQHPGLADPDLAERVGLDAALDVEQERLERQAESDPVRFYGFD